MTIWDKFLEELTQPTESAKEVERIAEAMRKDPIEEFEEAWDEIDRRIDDFRKGIIHEG